MRRREFITLLGATAAASPLAAYAEQAGGRPVLGVLMAGLESAPDNQKRIAAFRQAFAELGWKDRDNICIEYRWLATCGACAALLPYRAVLSFGARTGSLLDSEQFRFASRTPLDDLR